MGMFGSNERLYFEYSQTSVSFVSFTHGRYRDLAVVHRLFLFSPAECCPFLLPPLQRALSGWLAAAAPAKAGWKFITMETGAPCAMMAGQTSVPRWSAGSWASGRTESVCCACAS